MREGRAGLQRVQAAMDGCDARDHRPRERDDLVEEMHGGVGMVVGQRVDEVGLHGGGACAPAKMVINGVSEGMKEKQAWCMG